MRYENGILYADTTELAGLIRTAQEILPELDGVTIPDDVELVLDQTQRSPVRVAGFRLTNCIGAYNSGNTFDGLEARWAWKDANGVWHRETRAGALVAGSTRNEVLVRRWIANAPVVAESSNNTAPVTPVAEPPPAEPHSRRTCHFVGTPRSPRAYTNVPESVQGTITRACERFVAEGYLPGGLQIMQQTLPDNRDYRIAVRRGRTWFWIRLSGGTTPAVISGGRSGRAAAIRWVNDG